MDTTATLKKSFFLILYFFSLTFNISAQQATEPEACKKPPKGYEKDGYFMVIPNIACIDSETSAATLVVSNPNGINSGSNEYIFNYKDGDSLVFTKLTAYTVNMEGIYWIMQKGTITDNGITKNVLNCKSVEVIKTRTPDIEYSTCGPNTVNILIKDTPNNRKHSGYTVGWDEKNTINYESLTLPHIISYTFPEKPSSPPKVQGFYKRRDVIVCNSSPSAVFGTNFPLIELQSLSYAKEAKIQIKEKGPETEYYIQYKAKNATEWIESTTKIKRNATDTLAVATIIDLDPNMQYCFRLVKKDACNYNAFYSTEVCTALVLNTERISTPIIITPNPIEDKIQINSSGAPVRFVEIIDMKGRLIHKGETTGDTFDVSVYEKGKYILRLYDANRKLLGSKNIMKW